MTTTQLKTAVRTDSAFTLVELLMVISIIGLIAAMTVAAIRGAGAKRDRAAVESQMAKLILAIEGYSSKMGSYPPDCPANAVASPHLNPLAYELGGVRFVTPNFKSETDPTHVMTVVGPAQLASYFPGLGGFVNAGPNALTPPRYSFALRGGVGKTADYVMLTNGAPGIPAAMFLQVPADHPTQPINVWRYRAYPATGHNPKSFDLWAEVKKGGGGTNIIGNWR